MTGIRHHTTLIYSAYAVYYIISAWILSSIEENNYCIKAVKFTKKRYPRINPVELANGICHCSKFAH